MVWGVFLCLKLFAKFGFFSTSPLVIYIYTHTCSHVRWWTPYLRQISGSKKDSQEMTLGLIFNLNVLCLLPGTFFKIYLFVFPSFFKDEGCRGKWVAKNKTTELLKIIPCNFKRWPFYPQVFKNTTLFHLPEHLWLSSEGLWRFCTLLKPPTYVFSEQILLHKLSFKVGPTQVSK